MAIQTYFAPLATVFFSKGSRKSALLLLGVITLCVLESISAAQTRFVETPIATLTLSQRSGDLVSVRWKNPRFDVIAEPKLGDSVDEPLTRPLARYVSELIRIRKAHEDLLFFGRFNDTMGATVRGDANIRYSVFKSMRSTKNDVACVLVNFGDTPESAEVNIDGAGGEVTIATPFSSDRKANLPVRLTVSPHQLAVIVKRTSQ